ncbi:hypothetical protein SE17_13025 [Kouleothrix aurantiaca]|uniref:Uncharacterized protein n=1 Tax=Kouleothrix aurantiaca TaxID=186479 RepID=A0A0P9HDV7_9CHLR|nr:hypothetical protein SE17_13025 [Kouleothrix aurantiaca]
MSQPSSSSTDLVTTAASPGFSLATDLQPIQWPELPTARPYPQTLEEFLDVYGQRLLPSRVDQEAARRVGREHIWNFFFQISPEDVQFLQREERDVLAGKRQQCDALYTERRARLQTGLAKIAERRQRPATSADDAQIAARIAELEALIQAKSLHFTPHGRITIFIVLGVALAVTLLAVSQRLSTGAPIPIGGIISTFISWAIIAGIFAGIAFFVLNQVRAGKEQSEISAIKSHLRQNQRDTQDEPRINAALAELEQAYQRKCAEIDQRLAAMQANLKPILDRLPKPPEGSEVLQQLRNDIQRHKERYIDDLGLEKRLSTIARGLDDTTIPNPLPFISPGSIQEPLRIPAPYRPPQRGSILDQLGALGRRAQNTAELRDMLGQLRNAPTTVREKIAGLNRENGTELSGAKAVLSDQVRHLLARRITAQDGRTHLLHGVYYIEYMFIADAMLIHHGFFYDFILDKTTADRTAELFFQDVVAIEKSLEYREIPRRLDTEEALVIEDAPTISITLPSGDQRTFTFANRAYLDAVAGDILIERAAGSGISPTIELDPIQEMRLDADGALRFMSQMLRQHKYLRPS